MKVFGSQSFPFFIHFVTDNRLPLNSIQSNEKRGNAKMLTSEKSQSVTISTAEAFYRVFRALPKKDRLSVARYILKDEDIRRSFDKLEIPNETTLEAFAEEKSAMSVFHSVEELRRDLLS